MANAKSIGDVDAAFEALGPLGWYNLIQFVLHFVLTWTVGYQNFSMIFTGGDNPFRCLPPALTSPNGSFPGDILSGEYDNECRATLSNRTDPNTTLLAADLQCSPDNLDYELPKDRYFVSEFDLECDRKFLKGMTQTIFSAGYALGCFITPFFTDTYGRRPVLLIFSFLSLGCSIVMALSVNYAMFAVMKFLLGFTNSGVMNSMVNLMVEALVTRNRGFMFSVIAMFNWTFGASLLSPMGYLLRNYSWRIFQYVISAFYVIIFIDIFFMDETLRWLAANGRKEQALAVLKRASRWNNRNYDDVVKAFLGTKEKRPNMEQVNLDSGIKANLNKMNIPSVKIVISKCDEAEDGIDNAGFTGDETESEKDGAKPAINVEIVPVINFRRKSSVMKESQTSKVDEHLKFRDLFTDPMLRVHCLFVFTACLFCNLAYLGLTLMSSALVGSLYLNFFIYEMAEVPQAIFVYFYMDKLGRKRTIRIFTVIAGLSLITMAALRAVAPDQGVAIAVLSFIGKFGVTGAFNVSFTMIQELFPTNLRNSGVGIANAGTGIGGMLAPYFEMFMGVVVYGPGLVFGLTSMALGFFTLVLPETTHYQLPQTLAEMKMWGKENLGTSENSSDKEESKDKY